MQVPVVDQTAIAAPQYTAPGVAPMSNAAPQQEQALGQATQQTGDLGMKAGATIGDRLAEQVDDAKVTSGITASLSQTNNILYDKDNGYFHKLNQDAMDSYQPAKEAVVKAFQDQLDGLSNPIQQHMFQQRMNLHLLSIGKEMDDHNALQTRGFATSAAKDGADSYMQLALQNSDSRNRVDGDGNLTGPFAMNLFAMHSEVLKTAMLNGLNGDSPQTKALLLAADSELNKGIILKLLDTHNVAAAQKIFDEESAKGNINLRDMEVLGSGLKTETDKQAGEDGTQRYAVKTITGGNTPVTFAPIMAAGSASLAGQNPDDHSLSYAAAANTNVTSPSDGKVAKVWSDDKNGQSVQVLFPNGSNAVLSGLAATQVQPGDSVKSGDTVGVSGGGNVHYAFQDEKGNNTDPRSASQPQPDLSAMSDPDTWKKAVDAAQEGPEAPQIKKRIIAGLDAMHDSYRSMENQEAAQLFGKANNFFYGANYDIKAIPPSLFSQLKPEQQRQFENLQTEHAMQLDNQAQFFKTRNETDLLLNFYANPQMITTDNVERALPNLSRPTQLSLMQRAQANEKNPQGVIEAQHVNDLVTFYARESGINVNPKDDPDKQTLLNLKIRVGQDIDRIKAQNHGKVTDEQASKIVQLNTIRLKLGGPDSNSPATYGFQRPAGATGTAVGRDGKMHYTDGRNDLGPVQ